MSSKRFYCPCCGTQTNSTRCPQCGNDTQQDETENFPVPDRSPVPSPYSIFDHAQRGHVRNALIVAHHKHQQRRFSGAPLTNFGGL